MSKKITISEEQAKRIFDLDEADVYAHDEKHGTSFGTSETEVDGVMSDGHHSKSKPFTSYDFDDDVPEHKGLWGSLAYNHGAIGYVAESKKKLQEDNSNLTNNRYHIPDNLMNILQQNVQRLGDKAPKRLLALTNSGDKGISYKEMYRLKGVFDGSDNKFQDNIMDIGGDDMKRWIDQQLDMSTANDKNVRDIDQQILGKKKINRQSKPQMNTQSKGSFEPTITYENS